MTILRAQGHIRWFHLFIGVVHWVLPTYMNAAVTNAR